MGEAAKEELDVDAIIACAFDYFDRYVVRGDSNFNHVLLEGLEPKDGEWIVSIGFDQGRYKERISRGVPFVESTKDPIREIRHFHISASDGALRQIN